MFMHRAVYGLCDRFVTIGTNFIVRLIFGVQAPLPERAPDHERFLSHYGCFIFLRMMTVLLGYSILLLLLLLLLLAAMTYNQVQSLRVNHQRISFSR